jgi:hypothetical protein
MLLDDKCLSKERNMNQQSQTAVPVGKESVESARIYYGFVVQIAGDYIWATSRSKPDWAELDVEGFQREILQERLRLDDVAAGNFNVSLAAFYTFLLRKKHVAKEAIIRVIRDLEKYDNAYVSETFALANARSRPSCVRGVQSSHLRRRTVAYACTPNSPRLELAKAPRIDRRDSERENPVVALSG